MMNDVRIYTGKLFYDGSYTDQLQWVKFDDVRSELTRLRNKVAALTLVAYGTPENPKSQNEPKAGLPCKLDGACAGQNSVRQMCWPCQIRWHQQQAANIERALLAGEKPKRIEPRGDENR